MKSLYFLYLFICFEIIISIPIELKSYSEIELPKGFSEFIYNYTYPNKNKLIMDDSPYIYIFIQLSDYSKIHNIYEIINVNNYKEEIFFIPEKNDR